MLFEKAVYCQFCCLAVLWAECQVLRCSLFQGSVLVVLGAVFQLKQWFSRFSRFSKFISRFARVVGGFGFSCLAASLMFQVQSILVVFSCFIEGLLFSVFLVVLMLPAFGCFSCLGFVSLVVSSRLHQLLELFQLSCQLFQFFQPFSLSFSYFSRHASRLSKGNMMLARRTTEMTYSSILIIIKCHKGHKFLQGLRHFQGRFLSVHTNDGIS